MYITRGITPFVIWLSRTTVDICAGKKCQICWGHLAGTPPFTIHTLSLSSGRNKNSHTFTFSWKEQKCYHFHFLLEGTKIHTISCQLSQIFGKIVTRYIFNNLPGGFEITLSFSWSNFPTSRGQFVTYDIHNASFPFTTNQNYFLPSGTQLVMSWTLSWLK